MSQKYISFIFDDGPKELMCSMVDKILAYGWSAGFAIIGKMINDETEKQLQYAIDRGFELISHGWNHINLTTLSCKHDIAEEMYEPIKEVKKRLNYDITMARLPFITYNDLVMEVMTELGLPLLGRGVDGGRDWSRDATKESISSAVLNSVSDGAIACLHVTENTLKALDIILPELKKRDYTLVTAKELFKINNVGKIPLGIDITNAKLIQ